MEDKCTEPSSHLGCSIKKPQKKGNRIPVSKTGNLIKIGSQVLISSLTTTKPADSK